VVPLAAALSIPLTSASGAPRPARDLILVLAISQAARQSLQRSLDLEATRLSDDHH
jgi:hypothetical protein